MKQVLILAALLIASVQANAIIADRFKCDFSVAEAGGETAQQNFDFYIARLPLSASPSSDVRLTSASGYQAIRMDNNSRTINAGLNINYSHGVKLNSAGRVIDARQTTCVLLSADWCSHAAPTPGGGGTVSCVASASACFQSIDPFDPKAGWSVVGFVPDGTPLFDEKALISLSAPFKDELGQVRGSASVTCTHQGTYQ